MSSDLIAWVVAVGLGTVVVVVGLRRDLSETTRSNLPRFGEDSEPATAAVGLWEGEQRGRPPSPRQTRWLASLNLLLALGSAADAVLSADDRLLHAVAAATFALGAAVLLRRASRLPPVG
jgi:hypothetical protein